MIPDSFVFLQDSSLRFRSVQNDKQVVVILSDSEESRINFGIRDYSLPGGYFVTICAHKRECVFGAIAVGARHAAPDLSRLGHIVKKCWEEIPNHFPHVLLDEYVVTPNHIHGILIILGGEGKGGACRAPTLSAIVRSFKSASSKKINEIRKTPDLPLWQRNYYEHVVRDERDLNRIRQYIFDNPACWAMDEENPDNRG